MDRCSMGRNTHPPSPQASPQLFFTVQNGVPLSSPYPTTTTPWSTAPTHSPASSVRMPSLYSLTARTPARIDVATGCIATARFSASCPGATSVQPEMLTRTGASRHDPARPS